MRAESRLSEFEMIYVPKDEKLEDLKQETLDQGKFKGRLRNIVPSILDIIRGRDGVPDIDNIFKEPLHIGVKSQLSLPKILNDLRGCIDQYFKFDPPKTITSKSNQRKKM